ncbi:hypothetical protein PTTG_09126 [Puccinia triticina 1-1 BBBD Race 1]|uniref:Uncharacterized protein n=1 Tax=Puccinia triticina (isolate 1-1 / race 1 (BBBD)) TaxID=630390 RepID=A0A180G687_PUCT1|nr:hypothetical protein PTTG_09126 [Puccinia triticina 1-1 BBBD Race 1]
MSINRTPNHPASMTGLFEPLGESIPEAIRANQYGNVTTLSFLQCGGAANTKVEDCEIKLSTNTALNNVLDPSYIYYLTGKFIPLNNGSTPKLTYVQETVAPVMPVANNTLNFTNRAAVNSLGLVTSRQEVVTTSGDGTAQLEVIVSHSDWDPQHNADLFSGACPQTVFHQVHRARIKAPGQNLQPLHVGWEVKIAGRLVDFEMDTHMAVVVVSHVAFASGHQIGMSSSLPSSSGTNLPTTKSGRSPTKFTPRTTAPNKSPTPGPLHKATTSPSTLASKSSKGKGKAHNPSPDHSEDGQTASEEEFDEESEEEVIPKRRGRPRKDILKDAAKRMKRS